MIALIDYDNLNASERRRGVRHVMTRLLQTLGRRSLAGERKMDCRLYGGWFDKDDFSHRAQRLFAEVRREFPRSMPIADQTGTQTVLVRANLALALSCDRGMGLTHTYRRRSLPPTLRCTEVPFSGCARPSRCPISSLDSFIRQEACPEGGCAVGPHEVLHRSEQKLVDSMIVIDLAHFALATSERLIVVSADDDLWPGIRYGLLVGARVLHVVPRSGWSASNRYQHLETEAYMRFVM